MAIGLDDFTTAWEQLAKQLTEFDAAWGSAENPPELRGFLPPPGSVMRSMVLVELVKLDLQRRWEGGGTRRRIESYIQEFPELAAESGVPCDLIMEEYLVRKQSGEIVEFDELLSRFPGQAVALRRMFRWARDTITSASLHGHAVPSQIELSGHLDDFELLGKLGQGAFGTVYLARQTSMSRLVALKVSSQRSDEPKTLAQLDHPSIVRVYDQRWLQKMGLHLVYMEYVPGGTLREVIDLVRQAGDAESDGRLLLQAIDQALLTRSQLAPQGAHFREKLASSSLGEAVCLIGAQLADAIHCAHEANVLHRDIKPANVLLAGDGTPKLADFNISYASKLEGASPSAFFGGSVAYMSPEQLEAFNPYCDRTSETLDSRSDIYSLGVMLWELRTGRRPFSEEVLDGDWPTTLSTLTERRRQGVTEETRKAVSTNAPPGLIDVLLKCLAPDPAQRHVGGRELARQLRLCLCPHVRRLLVPETRGWPAFAQRYGAMLVVCSALASNAAISVPIVIFVYRFVVEQLGNASVETFFKQLLPLNVFMYSAGAALGVWLGWPVLQTFYRRPPGDKLPDLRQRALHLGDWIFWIVVILWPIGGLSFPIWLHLSGSPMALQDYGQFLVAHLLGGLVAGTLCFFFVTHVSLVHVYARLVTLDPLTIKGPERLAALRRRVEFRERLSLLVPFMAATLLGFAELGLRAVYGWLALAGMVVFVISTLMGRVICRNIDALALATSRDLYGAAEP